MFFGFAAFGNSGCLSYSHYKYSQQGYGDAVEVWAKDVEDIGIAERYFENFANDRDRGSMAWRCWQIGGYRCGNITRQAFDTARGEGHFLDLLWGGFPGADAPSLGTDHSFFKY